MRAIESCRTAALGGHLEVCDTCGFERPAYNSCRNRHCPKCQAGAQLAWVDKHVARVLPTHYFHVVFTLPDELRPLVHRNRKPPLRAALHGRFRNSPRTRTRAAGRDTGRDRRAPHMDPPNGLPSAPALHHAAAAAWPRTGPGSPRERTISSRISSSRGCSAASSLPAWPAFTSEAHSTSAASAPRSPIPTSSGFSSRSSTARTGSSTPSRPSPGPSRSTATSAATPTASPSPTRDSRPSTRRASASPPSTARA